MTDEYTALFFGDRVFSDRIRRRVIIIHNRLERQRLAFNRSKICLNKK